MVGKRCIREEEEVMKRVPQKKIPLKKPRHNYPPPKRKEPVKKNNGKAA